MGVRVKMVTGDQLAIAQETAKKLGLGTNILDASGFGDAKSTKSGAVADVDRDAPTASPRSSPSTSTTSSTCCRSAATSWA